MSRLEEVCGGWASEAASAAALRVAADPLGPGPGAYLQRLLEAAAAAAGEEHQDALFEAPITCLADLL